MARVLGLRTLWEHPHGLDGVAVVEDEVEILDLGEARLKQLLEVVDVAIGAVGMCSADMFQSQSVRTHTEAWACAGRAR